MVMPREERRDWLSSHYMFHCCCNACAIDQPNIRLKSCFFPSSQIFFIRNMTPEPSVFLCPSCKTKMNTGKKTEVVTCTNCGSEVDVEALKSCIAETWNALEKEAEQLQVGFVFFPPFFNILVQSWGSTKEVEERFISFTSRYGQLLDIVSHPCRLLYKVGFLSQYLFSCFHDFL